jgi:hypothetical protein
MPVQPAARVSVSRATSRRVRAAPLAARAAAPSTRKSVTPSAVGPANAAESRYDACRPLRIRNWLKARVPSVYERLTGQRPWEELRRLRELQWRPAAELEARALEKLRAIVSHAHAHVPHYRDLLRRAAVEPGEIHSIADLSRIPISRKADLRSDPTGRVLAANLPARRRATGSTAGSTGMPFRFFTDRATAEVWLGSYMLFREWANAPFGSRMLWIPGPAHASAAAKSLAWMRAGATSLALGERTIRLSDFEPDVAELCGRIRRSVGEGGFAIWGFPSYIARIAKELLESGAELPSSSSGRVHVRGDAVPAQPPRDRGSVPLPHRQPLLGLGSAPHGADVPGLPRPAPREQSARSCGWCGRTARRRPRASLGEAIRPVRGAGDTRVGGRVRGREVTEVCLPDDRQPDQIVRTPQRLGPDARLLESLPVEGHVGHRVPDDRAELGEASGLERFRGLPLERSEPPVLRQAPAAGQPSVKGKHDLRDQPSVHGRASRVPQRMPAVNRPSRRSAGRPRRPRRTPRERRAAPARARGSRGPRSGRTRRPSRDGRAGRASPSSRPGRRRW